MRSLHWLFLRSVALFISGIGFVIAGARAVYSRYRVATGAIV